MLACMAYVDLNPIRAGLCKDLQDSQHTSVQRRVEQANAGDATQRLAPMAGIDAVSAPSLSVAEYLNLVDWTGRIVRPGKRGSIPTTAPPILARLGLDPVQWQADASGIETRYWRAVGAVDLLLEKAQAIGQCWLKGVGVGRRVIRVSGAAD